MLSFILLPRMRSLFCWIFHVQLLSIIFYTHQLSKSFIYLWNFWGASCFTNAEKKLKSLLLRNCLFLTLIWPFSAIVMSSWWIELSSLVNFSLLSLVMILVLKATFSESTYCSHGISLCSLLLSIYLWFYI